MRIKEPPNTICEVLPNGKRKITYQKVDPETKELYKTRSEIPGPKWDGCTNDDRSVTIYHRNGNIKETFEIINLLKQGPCNEYDLDGVLIKTTNYNKGKVTGERYNFRVAK